MFNKNKIPNPDFEANPEFEQDPGYEKWITQQIIDETAKMIEDLDSAPDLNKFEPTDEIFERIVKEAHERGLLTEDDMDDENEEDD